MTDAQRARVRQLCQQLDREDAKQKLNSYDNMCKWLKDDHYSFYLQVKDCLIDVWNEIKSILEDIFEGIFEVGVCIAAAPVVLAVEGLKALGKFLDDL